MKILTMAWAVYDDLMNQIEEKLHEIPHVEKLLEIKGVGLRTVTVVVAVIGDIRRPKANIQAA